jgi:hypothetical protein
MMTSKSPETAPTAAPEPLDEVDSVTQRALDAHGIVSRQHTTYEWNGFRYSNSADAIAAAKRAAR